MKIEKSSLKEQGPSGAFASLSLSPLGTPSGPFGGEPSHPLTPPSFGGEPSHPLTPPSLGGGGAFAQEKEGAFRGGSLRPPLPSPPWGPSDPYRPSV